MPRIRKCTICGAEFISHNGIEVCGEKCREERKKRQNTAGNERRYSHESNIPFDRICSVCGEKFETIRNIYCSEKCAETARKAQIKELSDQYYKDHREKILEKARKGKNYGN